MTRGQLDQVWGGRKKGAWTRGDALGQRGETALAGSERLGGSWGPGSEGGLGDVGGFGYCRNVLTDGRCH